MYFVGIDIGKRHHDASVMDEQGEGRLHLTFANTSAGLERLLERLAKLAPLGPAHFRFALESTAHYWMGIHHAARGARLQRGRGQPAAVERCTEPLSAQGEDGSARLVSDRRSVADEPGGREPGAE